jgi:hypothetical protein
MVGALSASRVAGREAEPPRRRAVMFSSMHRRGFLRTAVALAGLVLAVALLGPSAAVAKKGGTDRPLKDRESGTTVLDLATGAFVSDTTGVASHLGRTSSHIDGVVTITGPDTFTVSGSSVTLAANGDELFGTFIGSGTTDAAGNSAGQVTTTFTGGTGRFANASGSATGPFSQVLTSIDATTATYATSYSFRGAISY